MAKAPQNLSDDDDDDDIGFDFGTDDDGTADTSGDADDSDSHDDSDEERTSDEDEGESGGTEEDAGTKRTDDDDDDDVDPEREAIRERRRNERKMRKQAAKERENAFRMELAARDQTIHALTERLNTIDRRNAGFDMAQIEGQMTRLNSAYAAEQQRLRDGTASGDGDAVVKATENIISIRDKYRELTQVREAYVARQNQPQTLDPGMMNHAQNWWKKNRWYDPSGGDFDSKLVLAIDQQMGSEGYDPRTPDFWEELTSRVKKHLPHRYLEPNMGGTGGGNKEPAPTKKRSPIGGSSRESSSAAGNGKNAKGYNLSPDRVRAMEEAGLWDDPKKRAEAIKAFQAYDRNHSGDKS